MRQSSIITIFFIGITFCLFGCKKEEVRKESKLGPVLTISPSKIEFGEVIAGNTKSSTITMKNIGDADITIASIQLENFSDVYFLRADISRLAPQKEESISITFRPKNVAEYNTKIIIKSNSGNTTKEIEITGSGNTLCGKCDTPPENGCSTENELKQYQIDGKCEGEDKKSAKCIYQSSVVTCDFGCDPETKKCKDDPCTGVVCNNPPDSCHLPEGICNKGNCAYPVVPIGTKCNDSNVCTSNDICNNQRKCKGTPTTCDEIPSSSCIASDTQRVYSAPNQCDPVEGCLYSHADEACILGKQCITDGCKYDCQQLSPTILKSSSNTINARFAGKNTIGLIYSEPSKKEVFLQIVDKKLQNVVAETLVNSPTATTSEAEIAAIVDHKNGVGIFWNEKDGSKKSSAYYRNWSYSAAPIDNILKLSNSLSQYAVQQALLSGSDYIFVGLGQDAGGNNIVYAEKRNISGQLDFQKNIVSSSDTITGVSASLGNNEIIINWTINNRIFLTVIDISGNMKTDYNPPIDISSALYNSVFLGKTAFDGTNYNVIFRGCVTDCNTDPGLFIATFGADGKRVFQDYPFVNADIHESIDFFWNYTRQEFAVVYSKNLDGLHFTTLDIQGTVTFDASITTDATDSLPFLYWDEQSYMVLFQRAKKNIVISNACNWN